MAKKKSRRNVSLRKKRNVSRRKKRNVSRRKKRNVSRGKSRKSSKSLNMLLSGGTKGYTEIIRTFDDGDHTEHGKLIGCFTIHNYGKDGRRELIDEKGEVKYYMREMKNKKLVDLLEKKSNFIGSGIILTHRKGKKLEFFSCDTSKNPECIDDFSNISYIDSDKISKDDSDEEWYISEKKLIAIALTKGHHKNSPQRTITRYPSPPSSPPSQPTIGDELLQNSRFLTARAKN